MKEFFSKQWENTIDLGTQNRVIIIILALLWVYFLALKKQSNNSNAILPLRSCCIWKSLLGYLETYIESLRILDSKRGLKNRERNRNVYLMGHFQFCITGISLGNNSNKSRNNQNTDDLHFLNTKQVLGILPNTLIYIISCNSQCKPLRKVLLFNVFYRRGRYTLKKCVSPPKSCTRRQ